MLNRPETLLSLPLLIWAAWGAYKKITATDEPSGDAQQATDAEGEHGKDRFKGLLVSFWHFPLDTITNLVALVLMVAALILGTAIAYEYYGDTSFLQKFALGEIYELFKWPIWLVVAALALLLVPKLIPDRHHAKTEHSKAGSAAHHGAHRGSQHADPISWGTVKGVLIAVGIIAALVFLQSWGFTNWLNGLDQNRRTARSRIVYVPGTTPATASSVSVVAPSIVANAAWAGTYVTTNNYGLRLVEWMTNNMEISTTVRSHQVKLTVNNNGLQSDARDIMWGGSSLHASNLVVYLNDVEIPSGFTPARTLGIGYYSFMARYTNTTMWVAIGKK